MELNRIDAMIVATQGVHQLLRFGIPNLDGVIHRSGDEPTIMAKRHTPLTVESDDSWMAQMLEFIPRGGTEVSGTLVEIVIGQFDVIGAPRGTSQLQVRVQ